jgi:UDP-N-acetylmuramoyl-tripeptide--D-alanyl-D-alanine ligase
MITTEQLYEKFKTHPVVCTDTRNIIPGSLFFALKGANFNGNSFAAQALENGAAYAVVDEAAAVHNDRCLLVPDVLEALQQLARHHRRQFSIPVIAITGSNGKTTSKELISTALAAKYNTLFTKGNLNNHIGVPLTLLGLNAPHEMAVIEMGANHQGEIALLCSIAEPDYGIITNIGKAHIEGFGGVEGIIKGKTEMYSWIRSRSGMLFVNADDAVLAKHAAGIPSKTYGYVPTADVVCIHAEANPFVKFSWTSKTPGNEIQSQVVGLYNLPNFLAAVCISLHFGVAPEKINEALANYVPSNSRSQLMEKGSNTILLDAYNANPSSMQAALDNFAQMKAANKLLILGDMLELGDAAEQEHRRVIAQLEQNGFTDYMLVGPLFSKTGKPEHCFADARAAAEKLKSRALQNTLILVKGSRGIKLEQVLDAFA